jgi:thiamine biosynthesis lipoprotein
VAASAAVRAVLSHVDLAYSRFRPDSELSLVNADSGRTRRISPLLADAIATSLRAAVLRRMDASPTTVGRAMRAVGYDDDFDRIRSRTDPISIRLGRSRAGRRSSSISRPNPRCSEGRRDRPRLDRQGPRSDLAAAAALEAIGGGGVWSASAATSRRPGTSRGGWRILVAEDSEMPPGSDGEVIALHDGAIATSSTTVRTRRRGEIALHHRSTR